MRIALAAPCAAIFLIAASHGSRAAENTPFEDEFYSAKVPAGGHKFQFAARVSSFQWGHSPTSPNDFKAVSILVYDLRIWPSFAEQAKSDPCFLDIANCDVAQCGKPVRVKVGPLAKSGGGSDAYQSECRGTGRATNLARQANAYFGTDVVTSDFLYRIQCIADSYPHLKEIKPLCQGILDSFVPKPRMSKDQNSGTGVPANEHKSIPLLR